jgi:hypothetical protein
MGAGLVGWALLGAAMSCCESDPAVTTAVDASDAAEPDGWFADVDAMAPDAPDPDTGAQFGPCTAQDPLCQQYLGRRWSEKANLLTYEQAVTHCAGLGARLPTISELRTLVVECPATAAGGACGVTDACTSSSECDVQDLCIGCGDGGLSVFKDEEPFWSSTPDTDQTGQRWAIAFRYNRIYTCEAAKAGPSAYCTVDH